MKHRHTTYPLLLSVLWLQLLLTGCGDNWFEHVDATDSVSGMLVSNIDEAEFLVDGIAHLMYTPYTEDGVAESLNGEGTMMFFYGTMMGQNAMYANRDAFASRVHGTTTMRNPAAIFDYFPWGYYYRLISNANALIDGMDNFVDTVGVSHRIDFLKAQGLTYRAYAYYRLTQLYCPRWSEPDAASREGLPMRLSANEMDAKDPSSFGETYGQILADLYLADSLYSVSRLDRGDKYWQPNRNVNYAILARVTLNKGMYEEAAHYAALARLGYSLMSSGTYASGFNSRTTETIWGNPGLSTGESMGKSCFFNQYMGYNRSYFLDYPICISRELYNQIPEGDVRRRLFVDPQTTPYQTQGGMLGYISTNTVFYHDLMEQHRDIKGSVYAYMNLKFKGLSEGEEGVLNLCRASEMYLIEAESYCELGRDKEAGQVLRLLNQARNSSWTLPQTADTIWLGFEIIQPDGTMQEAFSLDKHPINGELLRDEIRKWRAIELWGEGHDWYDLKRWGVPIVRNAYPLDNFTAAMSYTVQPYEFEGWQWVYPQLETDY